jgi:peptidoglycan/LPS O-acetylase OafA/YrhL
LYYAVVFVSLVVLPAAAAHLPAPAQAKLDRFGTIGADKWMYWTYLSNFAIAHAQKFRHGILDISWSLAIEEQFYLVWPAVVFACSRRALVRVSVGAVLLAIAFRCWLVFYGANAIAVHVLTPSRIDSLAVGAFIAIVARSPGGLGRLAQGARVVAPLSAAILALDFLWRFNTGTGAPGEVGLPSANLPEIQTFGLTAIAIFFGSVLVLTLQAGQAMAASSGRASRSLLVLLFDNMPMRSLGKYSYAMYLFHLPIRAMPRDLLLQKQLPTIAGSQLPAQIAFTFGCIGATYVAAWLSWNLYERHWLALKRFVEYS